jgi:hypothetical protein
VKRTLLALIAASLLAGACAASSSTTGSGESGIRGTVLLGPTCPVETIEHPCPDKPIVANVVVSSPQGKKVAGARSGDDGRFSVSVPPGDYVITVADLQGIPFAKPVSVSVPDGEFVEVTVSVDSGIR